MAAKIHCFSVAPIIAGPEEGKLPWENFPGGSYHWGLGTEAGSPASALNSQAYVSCDLFGTLQAQNNGVSAQVKFCVKPYSHMGILSSLEISIPTSELQLPYL